MPTSTTDMVSNTMDQAELNQCPCISSGAPWQAVIFPRGGDKKPFDWTYHFFWGLDEALNTFVGLWNTIETNRKVGMLFPQNADGETWGNDTYGLPVPTKAAGFEVIVPGYFQPRTNDYTAQITALQVGQLRYRRRHHLPGRHQDLRQPVRPAGLQAEGDHRRGGVAFRRERRLDRRSRPTACRPKSGGRRPSRSSPR